MTCVDGTGGVRPSMYSMVFVRFEYASGDIYRVGSFCDQETPVRDNVEKRSPDGKIQMEIIYKGMRISRRSELALKRRFIERSNHGLQVLVRCSLRPQERFRRRHLQGAQNTVSGLYKSQPRSSGYITASSDVIHLLPRISSSHTPIW